MASKTGKSLEVVMWQRIWLWMINLIPGTRGETEGAEGTATVDNAEGTGEADNAGSTDEGETTDLKEGGEDTGEADNIDPKVLEMFGGDVALATQFKGDPSQVVKSYKELMTKHKPIEMESAKIKNWAKTMGLQPVFDGEGHVRGYKPGERQAAKEKQQRFTEEHQSSITKMFSTPEAGKSFIEAMKLLVQDHLDDGISAREQQAYKAMEYRKKENDAWNYAKQVWPSVDLDTEGFPEDGSEHYKLAQQIYNANEEYRKHHQGMLFAVSEAAAKLNIAPQKVADAKREGMKEGLEKRKILKKVGGGSGGGTGAVAAKGELSMAEFINLPPSKRAEYQQRMLKK